MIIPKGTVYYENNDNEYVSETIVLQKRCFFIRDIFNIK